MYGLVVYLLLLLFVKGEVASQRVSFKVVTVRHDDNIGS